MKTVPNTSRNQLRTLPSLANEVAIGVFSRLLQNLRAAHIGLLLGLATLLASTVALAQDSVASAAPVAAAEAAKQGSMWGRLFSGDACGGNVFRNGTGAAR